MAHQVETMAYQGETPWHKLGTKWTGTVPPTCKEMMVTAGLDWTVETEPLQIISDGREVSHKAIVRSTDRVILGCGGPDWTPLQNEEMFKQFEPWVESGSVQLETAGSLRGGKDVWCLGHIQVPDAEVRPNDVVRQYILLSNNHECKRAIRFGFTPVRVVCANTLAFAESDENSVLLRVRHRKGIVKTLDAVRESMNLLAQAFEATLEQYRFLASRTVNQEDIKKYLTKIVDGEDKEIKGKRLTRFENLMGQIGKQINYQMHEEPTWWHAYNGVNGWICHSRGRSDENRLHSVWFGNGVADNRKYLELALSMAS